MAAQRWLHDRDRPGIYGSIAADLDEILIVHMDGNSMTEAFG